MLRFGRLFLVMVLAAAPWSAMALTEAECREVQEKYGIRAVGCSAANVRIDDQVDTPMRALGLIDESHVFFASGTELAAGEAQRLALLARVLDTSVLDRACLRLIGYSDASGSAEANIGVSRDRAQMVANYLKETLKDPNRIAEVVAKGEQDLLVGFPPDDEKNRRVAIFARDCAE